MATQMSASLPLPTTAHPTMRQSTMALLNLRYRASQRKTLGLRTRGWVLYTSGRWCGPPIPDARKGPELRAQGDHDQVILVRLSSRASPRPVEGSASGRHLPAWRSLPHDARGMTGSRRGKNSMEHHRTLGRLPAQQSREAAG